MTKKQAICQAFNKYMEEGWDDFTRFVRSQLDEDTGNELIEEAILLSLINHEFFKKVDVLVRDFEDVKE